MANIFEQNEFETPAAKSDPRISPEHAASPDNGRIRLLLLQARRSTDVMQRHELECFARHLEVPPETIEVFDLLTRPLEALYTALDDPLVRLFIGGSGDYSVSKPNPPILERFVREAIPRIVASGRPTFGSCWGLHTLACGLGGRVESRGQGEVGTFDVRLSSTSGAGDPLFAHMPLEFRAQMGHNDWVTQLPPGAVALCENDASAYQAVRFGDGPVYGLQFHAELSVEDNRTRYLHYIEGYGSDSDGEDGPRLHASPDANTILLRFRTLYCMPIRDAESSDG